MKKVTALILALLFIVCGCTQPEISPASSSQEPEEPPMQVRQASKEQLSQIWDGYILPGIANIFNHDFEVPEELDPRELVIYCWRLYGLSQQADSLERVEERRPGDSQDDQMQSWIVVPAQMMTQWIERYFDLEQTDFSFLKEETGNFSYSEDKNAILVREGYPAASDEKYPLGERNLWGLELTEALYFSDNIVTATLVSYDTYENMLVSSKQTITFGQRENGELYFLSCSSESINNHQAVITGKYSAYTADFGEQLETLSGFKMIGETQDSVYLYDSQINNINWGEEKLLTIYQLSNATFRLQSKVEIPMQWSENALFSGVSMRDGSIFVRAPFAVYEVSEDLSLVREVELPECIYEKATGATGDNLGFYGYDMLPDYSKFVYGDKGGLFLYDLETDAQTELIRNKFQETPMGKSVAVRSFPRFVKDDTQVISSVAGYESGAGWSVIELATGNSLADIPLYHVSPFDVYYDDGLAMIGTFIDNNKWPENGYYDFDTGEITLIEFESENTFSIRRTSEVGYDGQGYSAFLLPDEREDGYGWKLGVLDHDTCEVKENILTIQNAQAQVIGVLADGRVMVYYRVNSAEQGLLVTPPPR
ncbi:hypothetical protein [Youxingia wuxianensis]|uniref:WG repeat-containing protein n=1 Tax=Youxingia wuxianensis TaxID=2763678 RepID=A0A926IIQ4_9FIRM|nr:hypothetical protein [Youxingia wuxianensis]MBC8586440.1 hypothetical protein [Youxingia wuxianensis]